jgi:hypothetical protein
VRIVRGFVRFWWDFVVGDDWKVAATVAAVLAVGAGAASGAAAGNVWLAPVLGAAVALAFVVGVAVDLRRG